MEKKNANVFYTILGVIVLKFAVFFALLQLAMKLLPYDGYFSFPDILRRYALPWRLESFANFDGVHYLRIAKFGYYENGQAFFPLYPLLIKGVGFLVANQYAVAGLLLSQLSFAGALWLLYLTLKPYLKKNSTWLLIFVFAYPTAFFFQSVYTESLFLFLTAATFYFISKKQLHWAAFAAFLAALTRTQGVLLLIPFFVQSWHDRRPRTLLYSIGPLLGLGVYMVYLWFTVHDPLAFFHAQSAFGAGRSSHLILFPQVYVRYAKIFLTTPHDIKYAIAALECSAFTLALITGCIEAVRRYKTKEVLLLGIALFSLANILLPTATGTFLSEQRFALLAISQFIYFATIPQPWVKTMLAIAFSLLQVLLFTYFIQGYFVG